jgi:hypothetical protein
MALQEVNYIGMTLTGEAGADDALVFVRLVSAGREGSKVYARTLNPGENDPGVPIILNPDLGEELHFRPGEITISIQDVDRAARPDSNGYATITNTVWTWINVASAPIPPEVYRLLLSASRRLDTAYALYSQTQHLLHGNSGNFQQKREQVFAALGLSELLCIALSRAVRILERPSLGLQLPASITEKVPALTAMRNAFEHIDDRAVGIVRGKPSPKALSIFNQKDLVDKGVLAYDVYNLDLSLAILPMLVDARRAIFEAAVRHTRPTIVSNAQIAFKPS